MPPGEGLYIDPLFAVAAAKMVFAAAIVTALVLIGDKVEWPKGRGRKNRGPWGK